MNFLTRNCTTFDQHLVEIFIVTISEVQEEFEDTKGVIRIRKSKTDRQHNGQKKRDKQRSTKHYTLHK
jgi:hypothetical protein